MRHCPDPAGHGDVTARPGGLPVAGAGRDWPWRPARLLAGGPAAAATTAATVGPAAAAAAGSTVNVTVNAAEGLGTIPSTAYGLNTAVWDSQMNTTQTQGLLKAAGVDMLRYPGGSYGDAYNWQNNTVQGGYVAPGTDFDQFMGTAQAIGAQPILIANYGTGTPQEAAAWVQYANVTKGYGVKYWEIGNEQYGDGIYGANWEANNYSDKSPAQYATELHPVRQRDEGGRPGRSRSGPC